MILRVCRELKDGMVVNLGLGLPTLLADIIPADIDVLLHAENGVLGYGPYAREGEEDPDTINPGGARVTLRPGASFFHSADSFALVRGGHVDIAVLGALQVSECGDLANWMVPERGVGADRRCYGSGGWCKTSDRGHGAHGSRWPSEACQGLFVSVDGPPLR